MTRFVGIRHNRICVVSDIIFNDEGLEVIEMPSELSHLTSSDIITNCCVRDGQIKNKYTKKPANELKLALVGNWKMRCGISTYNEHLWPEVVKHVGDFKLFIEENEFPTGNNLQLGDHVIPEEKVVVCWKRNESLQGLVKELKEYNADIIMIYHEYGLFPNARYWLSLLSQLSDYRTIVVMHSVFPHHQDKMIFEAAIPEIIVHLDGAKNNLENIKKINAKVHVIPHGCYAIVNQNKLWDNYKSFHTFIQQGFLFRYKGWQNSLEAVSLLKGKYSDVFFTGLCSESPYAKLEHQIYYHELIELVEKLDIKENVSLIRGYQSDLVLDTFYRSNNVAIFPYESSIQHEVFGASGAARLAMAAGIPIITSSINHFSDLNSIKADTPEQIANELDKLFSSENLIKKQIEKQNQFIKDNSWEEISKKIIDLF